MRETDIVVVRAKVVGSFLALRNLIRRRDAFIQFKKFREAKDDPTAFARTTTIFKIRAKIATLFLYF